MRALSIRQPWAHLIVHGGKDVENRTWPTRFRGRFLIHAAKGMTLDEWEEGFYFARAVCKQKPFKLTKPATYKEIERGGIIGEAELVDCVTHSDSLWFTGNFGFVLANVRPLPFFPCKGALGFFHVDYLHSVPAPSAAAPMLENGQGVLL